MDDLTNKSIETRRDALRQMLGIGAGLATPLMAVSAGTIADARETGPAQSGPYSYHRILIPEHSHPALKSAAQILARKLSIAADQIRPASPSAVPRAGEIVFAVVPAARSQQAWLGNLAKPVKYDGYMIGFQKGGALVLGNRPRSLLYAAGDCALWRNQTSGPYVREPDFEIRTSHGSRGRPMAEAVALVGANIMQGAPAAATLKNSFPKVFNLLTHEEQEQLEKRQARFKEFSQRIVKACHDADVLVFTSIYGNNFEHWSPALYRAVIKAYPSIKGVPAKHSWEKCPLCPSEPMTWKIINAYIRELMEQSGADGFLATFWDQYGMYCQNESCKKNGLDKFPNEVYLNVKNLHDTVTKSLGKKLIVRTWSSGCPHWLGEEYVHAPGYGAFGGTDEQLWGRVIKDLPADIMLQTKVYDSDCEPDARFSPFIGGVKPHPQIAEWQIIGQFTGRYYFPAVSVNYTAMSMKKSLDRIGGSGGVNLGYGATMQTNYSLLDDIINGINLYAARELSWNVNADLDKVWSDWAVPIYGERAAPHIIKALKLSENAVVVTFSVLGLGSSTNSNFPGSISRRETLLRYTNRYYLPKYRKYLEPTKENIELVLQEKKKSMEQIDQMFQELELARPYITKAQAQELETRFNWLREFAICHMHLDVSLWRYRYLRHLASMLTTEPGQMKYLAESYDQVHAHAKKLFQYSPNQKFSCYDVTLGELRRQPDRALGSPIPLMNELYAKCRWCVEESTGPYYLPKEWRREPEDILPQLQPYRHMESAHEERVLESYAVWPGIG